MTAGRLWDDRRASIAILAAVSMLMMLSVAALSIDGAALYLEKIRNQRIADTSAVAAAFAYVQSANSVSVAQKAASSLAVTNGAGAATVTASMVASPLGNGMTAAMVTVTSSVTLRFAPVIGITTATVSAVAYGELHAGTPCIIGFVRGVVFSGAVNDTISGCDIGSNANIVVQANAHVTAMAVYTSTTTVVNSGGSLTTSPTANQIFTNAAAQSDPFAGSGVFAGLDDVVTAMTAPSFPSVGSAPSGGSPITGSGTCTIVPGTYTTIAATCTTLHFTGGSQPTNITGAFARSASATASFGSGTFNFAGGMSVSGSATVTMSFSGTSTLNVWNGLSLAGSAKLTVTASGAGTYDIQGGITSNSSNNLTFSNSGSGTSTFNVAGGIAVLNGTGTFPDGTYTITSGDSAKGAGIDVDGNATVSFGDGDFNVANGIYVASGALTIGNGANTSSVFQIPGAASTLASACSNVTNALDVENGASFTIGNFEYFEINGSVELDGAATLGGGKYYVEGTFHVGQCGSSGSTINATGASIIASSGINFGGTLTSVSLSAPTLITSATDGQPDTIVLASEAGSIYFSWGGTNAHVVGAVYAPTGTRVQLGSGSIIRNSGCLMLVADYVVVNSSSVVETTCNNLIAPSPSTTSVTVLQ